MRKNYSAPDIAFESFTLSTSIASNCEVRINTFAKGGCGYDLEGVGRIFLEDINGCGVVISDEMSLQFNGFCYHVPIESSNLFNS